MQRSAETSGPLAQAKGNRLNGGSMTIGAAVLTVGEWTLTKRNRLAETTHSGSGGNAEYKKTVMEADWTANIPWDSDQIWETDVALDAGDNGSSLKFTLGDSGKFFDMPYIVESVRPIVNNQQDVVRYEVTGKSNGAITDPVT